jgi:nucleotide-binding universal stress UspA family protein
LSILLSTPGCFDGAMKPKASISTIARTAARLSHDPDAAREATVRRDAGPFANVLVGVDGTPRGRDAIALAEWLRDEQGRLTLAHVVVGRTASYAGRRPASSWKEACRMLEREREAVGVGGALIGTVAPSVASGLHRLAEDRRADLLVVGSSARGPFGRLLRGDDTRGSLSGAPCAVAVAPLGYWAKGRKPIETIGVAYNATPAADAALAVARDIATHHGAELRPRTGSPARPGKHIGRTRAVGSPASPDRPQGRDVLLSEMSRKPVRLRLQHPQPEDAWSPPCPRWSELVTIHAVWIAPYRVGPTACSV